jgi:multicomponent K+:H+ antiporter subunit D
MADLIVLPTVLPALTAAFLLLAVRYDLKRQRLISVAATAGLLAIAIVLYGVASDGAPRPYRLGDWPAPFGIVLVLDRLSATMLVLAAALSLCVVLYAASGWDERGRHFHPLFQFQLLGINGAFLTGDVFNLFVFFEVMLIASYGLLLHGGGSRRLRVGFQYVAINLLASALFLFAVGLIYAVVGTLNMADLAVKAPMVGPSDAGLLRTAALLLFLVFAIKAALVPLHWWLPPTYAAASAPAAALFMIVTKVGVYAMLRVYGTVFGAAAGPLAGITEPWVLPAALATVVVGTVGILASRALLDLVAFAIVGSMGMLLIPVGLAGVGGVATALYYLAHSTLSGAALFLIVDLVAERRGRALDRLSPGPEIPQPNLLGGLFLLGAIAIVGIPPLSGFIGKLMILEASRGTEAAPWVWSIVLGMTLVTLLGFARAGSAVFWNIEPGTAANVAVEASRTDAAGRTRPRLPLAVAALLIAATAALSAFAGPVTLAFQKTAEQTLDTHAYVHAVLGRAAPAAQAKQ